MAGRLFPPLHCEDLEGDFVFPCMPVLFPNTSLTLFRKSGLSFSPRGFVIDAGLPYDGIEFFVRPTLVDLLPESSFLNDQMNDKRRGFDQSCTPSTLL